MNEYPKWIGERGTPERHLVHTAEDEARFHASKVPVKPIVPDEPVVVEEDIEAADDPIAGEPFGEPKRGRGRPPKVRE